MPLFTINNESFAIFDIGQIYIAIKRKRIYIVRLRFTIDDSDKNKKSICTLSLIDKKNTDKISYNDISNDTQIIQFHIAVDCKP